MPLVTTKLIKQCDRFRRVMSFSLNNGTFLDYISDIYSIYIKGKVIQSRDRKRYTNSTQGLKKIDFTQAITHKGYSCETSFTWISLGTFQTKSSLKIQVKIYLKFYVKFIGNSWEIFFVNFTFTAQFACEDFSCVQYIFSYVDTSRGNTEIYGVLEKIIWYFFKDPHIFHYDPS